MGAHPVYLACLWVYKIGEASPLGTLSNYLPGSMAVYAENKPLLISKNRTATADIVFERAQRLTITRQHPLATTFLLLDLSLLDLTSALWAECMTSAESLPALGAGQLQAGFEMFNANCAMVEVHVFNRQTQSLADPTAEVEQEANQQPISQVSCCLLHQGYLFWFNISLH